MALLYFQKSSFNPCLPNDTAGGEFLSTAHYCYRRQAYTEFACIDWKPLTNEYHYWCFSRQKGIDLFELCSHYFLSSFAMVTPLSQLPTNPIFLLFSTFSSCYFLAFPLSNLSHQNCTIPPPLLIFGPCKGLVGIFSKIYLDPILSTCTSLSHPPAMNLSAMYILSLPFYPHRGPVK